MLRKTTVFPGMSHGGKITLSQVGVPERGLDLVLDITVDSETHSFKFFESILKK
jgi:hypothetical protein